MLLVGTHLQLSFAPVGLVSAPCFVSSAVLHPAQQKLVVPFVSLAFVLLRYLEFEFHLRKRKKKKKNWLRSAKVR